MYMNTPNNNIISHEQSFWMDDVSVLFRDGGYIKFVPTSDMARIEQLNAITRFFMYLIIILFIFDKNDDYMYIPIIGIIMVIVIYNISISDDKTKQNELHKIQPNESMTNIHSNHTNSNYKTYNLDDDDDIVTIDTKYMENQSTDSDSFDYELNNLEPCWEKRFNSFKHHNNTCDLESLSNTDHHHISKHKHHNNTCDLESLSNMDHHHISKHAPDFNNDNHSPVACNSDDEDIKQNMDLKFNEDMYHDIEDVFDKKNSQRQFFTVAHTIPNDMEAFANWCYKFPPTCKTNQERCLRYEDLRMKYL
jgi:hypothetical protein